MRLPAFGVFAKEKNALAAQVEKFLKEAEVGAVKKHPQVFGAIVPHGKYEYSGRIAAAVFAALAASGKRPDSIVILAPNHAGIGEDIAMTLEDFQTPLGIVKNDTQLGQAVMKKCDLIKVDDLAHMYENGVEAQLPFLQKIYGTDVPPIVPLAIAPRIAARETCEILADAIKDAAKETKKDILVIASSNLAHLGVQGFYPDDAQKDPAAWIKTADTDVIKAAEKLDVVGTYEKATASKVCGFGPITVLLHFLQGKVKAAEMLDMGSSYDVDKKKEAVTGYGAVIFV